MRLDLVLVSLGQAVLLGVYHQECLLTSYASSLKTSEGLIEVFSQAFEDFKNPNKYSDLPTIEGVYYAKGPGSFTSLKLTHIFLHTLALTKGFELYSTTGFYFNDNTPILAYANQYFVSEETQDLVSVANLKVLPKDFSLPPYLEKDKFTQFNTPFYILPPI
ncbi:hypothetical protein [Helicobacter cetorum]|uniref:Universal bacterial protein YeaZ n=1 Tax=Helicobacter cetorum (strain ATCC BAA-540 / CCUG 52418 / MIT 99-5656) TaxID=1163745 RepID=I0EUJ6_HELCM|nr:hypothetical protein [Helicobacter cetorum]AFI06615.1 hypothetical protein HCD_08155 [Helicobacter cetorum MIT 99-5656]